MAHFLCQAANDFLDFRSGYLPGSLTRSQIITIGLDGLLLEVQWLQLILDLMLVDKAHVVFLGDQRLMGVAFDRADIPKRITAHTLQIDLKGRDRWRSVRHELKMRIWTFLAF